MYEHEQIAQINEMLRKALRENTFEKIRQPVFEGELKTLYENLCALLEARSGEAVETQVAAGKIRSVTEEIANTIEDNSRLSGRLLQKAQELDGLNGKSYRGMVETAEGIRGMARSLEESRKLSEDSRQASTLAETAIHDGLTQIYQIIGLVGEIGKVTRQTVDYMEKFSGATAKISEILKNVDNIARQTELLSFNAAIESHRAGMEGRGFAVIATAIRELAEDSKRQVTEIGDVIADIHGGLGELQENVDEGYQKTLRSVECSQNVESGLSTILKTQSELSGHIESILRASQSQADMARREADRVQEMERTAGSVNSGFQELYGAIRSQKDTVAGLSTLGALLAESSEALSRTVDKIVNSAAGGAGADEKQVREIFEALEGGTLAHPEFLTLEEGTVRRLLDDILDSRPELEAIWVNDARGRFIYCRPPAGITNARARDWFRRSIAGERYVSSVYISVLSKRPCVTLSLPIPGPDGSVAGVLGADLRVQTEPQG